MSASVEPERGRVVKSPEEAMVDGLGSLSGTYWFDPGPLVLSVVVLKSVKLRVEGLKSVPLTWMGARPVELKAGGPASRANPTAGGRYR